MPRHHGIAACLSPRLAPICHPWPTTRLSPRARSCACRPDRRGRGRRRLPPGPVTNDVTGPLPVWAGLLTAAGQGAVRLHRLARRRRRRCCSIARPTAADELVKRLSLYRLRRKIGDRARRRRSASTGRPSPATAARPIRGSPRSANAGSRRSTRTTSRADAAWLAHRLSLGVTEGRAELGDVLWLETQCRRTERRELLQGLLCRPGEHRADELAAEGQPAAGGGAARPTRTRSGARRPIPSLGWRSITCGSRTSIRPCCRAGWRSALG